ncbi:methyltransferase domain-containing protein [Streptomyces sp. ODS28]|uniref:methyltransferase domain-containing protein n=1 Tax=Streptomyces sp. ODS28 TaxID=3136688 RepID=UPI0031ECA5F8
MPRSAFLPDEMWPWDMATGTSVRADRRSDPEGWARFARSDAPIVTQWDDGAHRGPGPGSVPTSSSSMPSVVAGMLGELALAPGMRVLELGTGTGWSTALLAHRLGEDAVVSVEIDEAVAETARHNLRRAGLHPTLLVGDGTRGHPAGAPYDRIIATAGLRRIPPALLGQLRPGGLLLAPWGTDYANQDALLRLTADGEGGGCGRFLRPLEFMKARAQRSPLPRTEDYVPEDWSLAGPPLGTALAPGDLGDTAFSPARWALGLAVPRAVHRLGRQRTGVCAGWWYSLSDRSWAAASWEEGREARVWQGGERRLWDAVEDAWRWWDANGRPGHERYGLTVTPDGEHRPWLDSPAHRVPTAPVGPPLGTQ